MQLTKSIQLKHMTQHGAILSNFQANLRPLGVLSELKLPESLGSDVLIKLIKLNIYRRNKSYNLSLNTQMIS